MLVFSSSQLRTTRAPKGLSNRSPLEVKAAAKGCALTISGGFGILDVVFYFFPKGSVMESQTSMLDVPDPSHKG